MKLRFSIRDLALLTAVVALSIGWFMDHRSEEKVIRLHQEGEDRLVKQINNYHGTVDVMAGVLKSYGQQVKDLIAQVRMLRNEIRDHYSQNTTQSGTSSADTKAPATQ
ncbi:MAG TPA: hypothetical protein VGJ04_04025 [Pirellulales bacterium]|jgi:hypothetical protein